MGTPRSLPGLFLFRCLIRYCFDRTTNTAGLTSPGHPRPAALSILIVIENVNHGPEVLGVASDGGTMAFDAAGGGGDGGDDLPLSGKP